MIEKYIEISKNFDTSSRGSNKKCYVFDNVVLLKGSFVNNGEEELIRNNRINMLYDNGVNVCRILESAIVDNNKYELQEKASGEELFSYDYAKSIDGQQKYLSVLDSLSGQDIPFYEKFLADWLKIMQMGLDVDPSKSGNFFYDGEKISFIDLNLSYDISKRLPWIFKEAAVVLRGGGLLWQCRSVYDEANEKIKIIYQKLGTAGINFGLDIDDYISFFDSKDEYGLREYFDSYQNLIRK